MSSFRCVSSQLKPCDMGRSPCCAKVGLNRGAWTAVEDQILTAYISAHGEGKWRNLPKKAGLKRCGKSCRLRWLNYLKPGIKRGNISPDEDELIVKLHNLLGNRWSLIAGRLPGRTDNEIKNYWNSTLSKRCRAHPSSEPSRTSLAKRSTVKNSNAENSSSEANLNLSPVPAAIRTKAHRFTKRFVQCALPPRDQESFIKSTPQNTLLEPLISEPHQESHNGGEVHNLQITADHSNNISLDPLELSSHYFEARDNGAKKGEECSLKISSIDFPESDDGEKFECSTNFTEDGDFSLSYDHLTLEYMVDDLFQDDNMINLSSLACWLDDEDWPLEENKTTCQKLN